MKFTIFITITFILIFNSCTSYTYFYSTMSTNDPYTFKNNQGEFVLQGDSIDVIYNFNGMNAPITVGVYNKMSIPIYIDWRKSGVVIDNHSATYKEPLDIYAAYGGDTSIVDFGRYLNDPEGICTIKPGTRSNTQVLELTNFNFHKIPKDRFQYNHIEKNANNDLSKLKRILYTEEDSPIYVETFLSIYESANNISEPLIFETAFYMSELINAESKKPSDLSNKKNERGDFFYVKREKNTKWKKFGNTSLKVLGGVALVTGNIIVWALESGNGYAE
ncbi:hypothetical protein LJC00_04255 [Dysgonomonas sp. OttesenSCG-928-M03]|nr:hypothetical protein [Dysgonomonas sp. OttesenSCG-928-M03]